MRLKSELYKKEQEEICDKVINILKLDKKKSITLYDLDNDTTKQKELEKLIPEIRKYFAFSGMIGISEPKKVNKPWMSVIRNMSKVKYDMITTNCYLRLDKNTRKKTMRYFFMDN
mgnify:CR=1 FL=1|jgi:hypothetical protein